MISLVTGLHRSGTSMAMRALIAGGLTARYDDTRDSALNATYGSPEYVPNPNGYFIIDQMEFRRPDFADEYDGYLLKCHARSLYRLPAHEYRILFMMRNAAEIASSQAAMGLVEQSASPYLYLQVVTTVIEYLTSRADVSLKVVDYGDLIKAPVDTFKSLDWSIDAQAAASTISRALYRNKESIL